MKIEKLYTKIFEWANKKDRFTDQELYNKFPKLNTELKEWYLKTFKGSTDSNNCLIGVYICDDKKDSFYNLLTAKGRSEYLKIKKKWWEKTWVQILFILGSVAGIISLYFLFIN